jgi:carbonic anhydrase
MAPIVFGLLVLSSCGGGDGGSTATDAPVSEAAGEVEAFGYEGEIGPNRWAELDPEWELCATGNEQSPIDLGVAVEAMLSGIEVSYATSTATITDIGATIRADFSPGSSITVDGVRYDLAQVHYHAPSEHILNNVAADAEFHFVHKSADGELAVIGVLVFTGETNSVYAPLVDGISATPAVGMGDPVEIEIDVSALMGELGATFRYDGSLTTPPCSEGVEWIVRSETIELSAAQVASLTARYEGNARPVQGLGERQLLTDALNAG